MANAMPPFYSEAMMISAVRNTCFAILSSIESDLREFLGDLALSTGDLQMLPPDVRDAAMQRFLLDSKGAGGPDNDIDLLAYTDFADLGKMLRMRSVEAQQACGCDVLPLAEAIEKMAGARNRVCHSRPLEEDDLAQFLDLKSYLLKTFTSVDWQQLRDVEKKIQDDPTFVFRLTIPDFWQSENESIHHNLPVPDFDETGFIGRTNERREVMKHLFGGHPVITIVGEGGVGKSALAVRCLYDVLDFKEKAPYEAIVWVSLKTKILTPTGVQEIRDSVVSALGVVQSAAENLGAPVQSADLEAVVKELRDYLQRLKILLVIDNLETISTDGLREFLSSVPAGSKILITSRVGLGEIELRYKLDHLDKKQSVSLARRYAKSLNLQMLSAASDDRLERYCKLLYFNPLLIKWFVSSVASGADPERLLAKGNQAFAAALQFCFENLFTRLSQTQRDILHILASARRPLTQAELFFLLQDTTHLQQSELEASVAILHNSSMLKQSLAEPRRVDSGTQLALTDVAGEYIARFAPPPPKLFEKVQGALKKLREMSELSSVKEASYKYDLFAVRSSNRDERIAAVYLNRALQYSSSDDLTNGRLMIAKAKSLLPTFPEAFRISSLVESHGGDLYRAAEEIDTAVELSPTSPLVRYQYALFLLNQMDDSQQALSQIDSALKSDPGDETLETIRALALTRLGHYKEAAEIYEHVLSGVATRSRKWRITTRDQAAECYRRWVEQDSAMTDYPAARSHLERALAILEEGFGCQDFDVRMSKLYLGTVEDGLFFAIHTHDSVYAMQLLGRLRDAGYLTTFPAFRRLTMDHFSAEFVGDEPFLFAVKDLGDRNIVRWAPDDGMQFATHSEGPLFEGNVTNLTESFGFVRDTSGHDWFFHRSHLLDRTAWPKFEEGKRVRFCEGQNKQGKCAVKVELI